MSLVEDPEYQKMVADVMRLKRLRAALIESDRLAKMVPGDNLILKESKDLIKFVEHAWHILEPPTRKFKKGWAIDTISLHLTKVTEGKIKHLLINVPPGFMKSLLTKVFWPAWEWGPMGMTWKRYISASYAQSLSTRDARKLKRLITSEWYQRLWPHVKLSKDQAQKANFHNTKTGFMLGTSVGGVGTGERGDYVIVDDANNVRESESVKVRTETNLWRSETVPTRINDPETSAFIDIQQRVHDMDVSGFLLHPDNRSKDMVHLCIPMEFEVANRCVTPYWKDPRTYEGELAWPERFDAKEVARLKKALKPYAASAQLQQRPTIRGGGIIKTKHWNLWKEKAFPPMEFIIASFDGAYTKDEANDPSAFTIWGVWRDPTNRMINVMLMFAWEEYYELNEAVERIKKDCKTYMVDKLLIENKATGKSVSQELKRRFRGEIAVEMIEPKGDKVSRTFAVQHIFEDGMVYTPVRVWSSKVIEQVGSMSPAGCTAPHDDLVDTVTQALGWLRRNGFALLKEEGTGEKQIFGKELQNSTEPIYDV